MIVWLWDAGGTGLRGRGISDDQRRARRAAAALLRSGNCAAAQVEEAIAELGMVTLTSGYRRTGRRWQARRGPHGGIWWKPLPPRDGAG